VYARENDWETSIRSFNRALELDPSRTSTYTRYSFSTLRPLRRNDEAWRLLDIAREKDPLSLDVQMEIGQLELCTGRYDDAVATLERVNAAQPSIDFLQVFLVRALTFAGRLDDAFAKFEAMGKEGFPAWYALALVRAGRRAEAEALAALHRDNSHRSLFISAALGDLDSAFAALERQAVQDPQRVPMILTYPELAILYGDPRLEAIRQRFRLPPAPVNSAPM
jgi:tetratricopeptide (TPR) repeat protein